MRLIRHTLLIFATITLLIAAIFVVQRRKPSEAMWIAFTQTDDSSNYAGSGKLFRILPNGDDLQYLADIAVWHWSYLNYSPDGTQIAYSVDTCTAGCDVMYTVNVTTGENISLSEASRTSSRQRPVWSSDGEWLYFRYWDESTYGLFKMRPDGSQFTSVATETYEAMISPNGMALAVVRARDDSTTYDVYINTSSRAQPRLVAADTRCGFLSWSPDSRYISYVADDSLIAINSITAEKRILATDLDVWTQPMWSPDSQELVLTSGRNRDIYRIGIDGSVLSFPQSATFDLSPSWSPDGRWIAYVSQVVFPSGVANRESHIALMRPDGSDRHIIPNTLGVVETPVWSPLIDLPYRPLHLIILSLFAFIISMIPYPIRRRI